MLNGRRVLIVDEISDTEEVLRAVLEPRGVQVDRIGARTAASAAGKTSSDSPFTVVVIDEEHASRPRLNGDDWQSVPQVIIGSAHFETSAEKHASESEPHTAERHYLRKPFQYAELIQAIEHLIARKAA